MTPEDPHHPPRLLAIDDSELIHKLLETSLRVEGLEVHAATTGAQGIAMARTLEPDVILLDIEMPGLDGFEVLGELKANAVTHDIPVVILSATADTDRQVRGLEMGAIDFIAKPFDPLELRARLRAATRLGRTIKLLSRRARIDSLTGLWNRRYFGDRLEQEVNIAHRHGTPLSLMFCDLDHFKQINDQHGHPFADTVLREFARLLAHGRAGDTSARYGGEEFVVILPRSVADEAATTAERIRRALRCRRWNGHEALVVTASFGVTDLERAAEPTAGGLVASADEALYRAKSQGRDRVEIAPSPSESLGQSA